MIGGLFAVGLLAIFIGLALILIGAGGRVSASTQFGDFSGTVGPVALILGIVLCAISVLV